MLENQLFMLTGGLVLFDFGPRLLGQVRSWATLSLWDERWLRIRASRLLPSQMTHCAPGAGTSFWLQIRRAQLLDGTIGKCLSRNIDSLL